MRIGLHVLRTDRNDLKAIYYGVLLNELNSTIGGSLPFHSAEVAVPSDVIISAKTYKTKSYFFFFYPIKTGLCQACLVAIDRFKASNLDNLECRVPP